ncbi:MAG TPA: L,D-transpeptidase [Sporichthyaceae bacterium]|nr:L,D-transpeptidase [Sporichthyaceae bacterium]
MGSRRPRAFVARALVGAVAGGCLLPAAAHGATAAHIDPRCRFGRVVCIDKRTHTLRWVVNGDVQFKMSVRFGPVRHPTREGDFYIYWKDRHHISKLTGETMPYSLFFSGGEAVHYSPDFARRGYVGASSGCVDTRDLPGTRALWAGTRAGDRVVIYHSKVPSSAANDTAGTYRSRAPDSAQKDPSSLG